MYDTETTIEYIEMQFPHLQDELHDETWDGLLHPQIAAFSRWAQSIVDIADRNAWSEITKVFMVIWSDCSPEVENALNVSFLEHLHFADGKVSRSWAYKEMPHAMRQAWNEMEEYNRKIHGG